MKKVTFLFFASFVFISCSTSIENPSLIEFTHFPNNEITTKNKNSYFLFNNYFIENAPRDNDQLRKLTDKYSDSLMKYNLNDSLHSVTFFFFTNKEGIWSKNIDESYYTEGYGPEDYYNPRRAEYSYRLDSKGNIRLEKIIYENETRKVIPKVSFIETTKLKNKNE